MKKVLVATCVMAMTAFGITNASADTVSSARGSAFGVNLELLGEDLIETEPQVTSVLGDGLVSEDIITPEVEPVTVAGTGVVVANTSAESTIVPFTFDGGEAIRGGDGGDGGDDGGDDGLIGGIFDDLLGGGGDDGGGGGTLGGLGGVSGLSEGDAGVVEAQQLGGDDGEGEGTLGGLLGGELLGGLIDGGDEGSEEIGADDEITIPAVNALGFARIEDLNLVTEDGGNSLLGPLDQLTPEVRSLLIEALLEIEAVTAEAVAVCVDNQVFFDTSSNIVSIDNEPVTLIDDLLDSVSELTEDLGLLEIVTDELIIGEDSVGVNALRITLLDDAGGNLLGGGDDGEDDESGVTGGVTGGVAGTSEGDGTVVAQQLGGGDDDGGDPLLEVIIGHAEVSGSVCAAPPAPPGDVEDLPPSGPGPTLPVTGGGFGILPAVLAVGLTGGALAAGRLALRARREHTL